MSFKFVSYEFPVSRDGEFTKVYPDNIVLRDRREHLGLSQQQVADMTGISLGLYQRLEYGKDNLAGCSMRVGLAVCAALLLDPYEMVGADVDQPDPATLRPQEPFDPNIPHALRDKLKPKRVGRKQIRREVMTVYVNHPHYCLIIPSMVLEALGRPEYIQLLTNANERRIAIRAAVSLDEQSFDVPKYTYEGSSLVFPGPELIAGVKKELGWDDDVYAVDCFLVKDKDSHIVVLADLNTSTPSECPVGPFTVPQVLDEDEDTAVEDYSG